MHEEAAIMPASPCCLAVRRRAPFFAVLVLLQQLARFPPAAAVARTNLTAGAALTPPDYLTSPSGGFAFGFRALDADPTRFILATWFRLGDGDPSPPPPQSVVWFAKKSTGATPNGTAQSVLSITAEGQLVLTDGASNQVLWKAPTTTGIMQAAGTVLTLTDSGNARFLGDGGAALWESFWYPTDTLLPGQMMVPSSRYDMTSAMLFSKRADAEFATGRFSLAAQSDGNVVLCIDLYTGDIRQNAYWATGTNGPDPNTTITFDDQGGLNYTLSDGSTHTLISPASSSAAGSSRCLQFVRMDPDGVVRAYARPKSGGASASWAVTGVLPGDGGCNKRTSGMQHMCGTGSYCVETKERLSCLCPAGYTYIDPQHHDSGCTPEFEPQICGGGDSGDNGSDQFSIVELPNTTWDMDMYKKIPSVTEEQCRAYCLGDCFCTAALMVDGSVCVELGALSNGLQASAVTTTALIKVRTGNTLAARTSAIRRRAILRPYYIVTICLGIVLAITIVGLAAQHYYLTRKKKKNRNKESQQQQVLSSSVRAFSWKELHQATNGFDRLLGKGNFGEVYKGTLRWPQPQAIAVKKLVESNEYSEQEFTNEVQSVGQIHHRNLVRMIGYCKEGKHRMLVFEFMPGGSLRRFLFDPEKRLPWRWRAEAALAIARGLEYLHDGCSAPIIHCDIKPDNILLDGHGLPRITDFGISKLLGTQQVHTTVTNIRGTRGYIAPEWLRSEARVDTKADVYSFGVVLLEMISCRRCQDPVEGADSDDETVTLFGWAAQLVGARRVELMLVDGDTADDVEETERLERFARVALWCIEPNPALRPTMHLVVHMLETTERVAQVEALPADPPSCYMESSPLIVIPQLKIE